MQTETNEAIMFGERLRETRLQQNLSQGQLAKLSKITISQISRYENGITAPSGFVLKRICEALNISYRELIGKEENFELNMEDFKITIQKAMSLPKSRLKVIKEVLDTFIENNNIHSALLK